MGEKIRTELPEEEYERLVQISEKTGKSLSQVLREAVNEYTSRHEEVDQKTAEKTDEYLYGERLTTRMGEDELELVESLADEIGVSKSDAIRIAVRRGAKEELISIALQRYQEGEIGMRDAAELADVTISEMMAEANERGVLSNYDEDDLQSDMDSLI